VQARGNEIRRLREESGYGLRAFADLVGISPSWLSKVENDKANPSPDVLRRIALALQGAADTREAIAKIAQQETEGSDDTHPAD
jgi:transcriptional regulator with XRE-family HTH domain